MGWFVISLLVRVVFFALVTPLMQVIQVHHLFRSVLKYRSLTCNIVLIFHMEALFLLLKAPVSMVVNLRWQPTQLTIQRSQYLTTSEPRGINYSILPMGALSKGCDHVVCSH